MLAGTAFPPTLRSIFMTYFCADSRKYYSALRHLPTQLTHLHLAYLTTPRYTSGAEWTWSILVEQCPQLTHLFVDRMHWREVAVISYYPTQCLNRDVPMQITDILTAPGRLESVVTSS